MEYIFGFLLAIVSEIVFLLSFFLIFLIIAPLQFLYVFTGIRQTIVWMLNGLMIGVGCILSCYFVTIYFEHLLHYTTNLILLIIIILPIIGEIAYFRHLHNHTPKTSYFARLHLALKGFPQRGQFEKNLYILKNTLVKKEGQDFIINDETNHLLRQGSYDLTQIYLKHLLVWNFLGYVLGIIFIYYNFL